MLTTFMLKLTDNLRACAIPMLPKRQCGCPALAQIPESPPASQDSASAAPGNKNILQNQIVNGSVGVFIVSMK